MARGREKADEMAEARARREGREGTSTADPGLREATDREASGREASGPEENGSGRPSASASASGAATGSGCGSVVGATGLPAVLKFGEQLP